MVLLCMERGSNLDIFLYCVRYGTCSSCAHDNRVIAVINHWVLAGDCVLLHLQEAKKINYDMVQLQLQYKLPGLILIIIRI